MIDVQPLLTIVVATLNSGRRLSRCLGSIGGQTYLHREVIVKDGGSTDGTLDIVRAHAGAVTHWESSQDHGIYDAWNKALPHARGEWVCFMGADDYLWSPTSLERIVRAVGACHPGTRLLSGRVAVVNHTEEVIEVLGRSWQRRGRASLRWLPLPYPAVFHHASVFRDYGGFDESFRIAGDYELLVRVLQTAEVDSVPEIIVGMEVGGVSSAIANETAMLRDIARVWEKHGLTPVVPLSWWRAYSKAWTRAVLRRAFGGQTASQLFDLYRRATGRPRYWTLR